jgi:hypothetical protein
MFILSLHMATFISIDIITCSSLFISSFSVNSGLKIAWDSSPVQFQLLTGARAEGVQI